MPYSTLKSLESSINQILDHDRYPVSPHEKQHIISLDKYVISFQAFLEDFPEKAEKLEPRIRDVAMEAEDVIEWYMTEKIRYSIRYTNWIAELRRIKFKFQMSKVRDQMDSIAGEVVEIKNSIITQDAQLDDFVDASSSSRIADAGKTKVVGLNEDLIEIMTRLCGDSPQLQILPITGMGGIGKTTLARNAFDNPFVVEHFQVRAWVTISQDYTEGRILSDLLDAMKEFNPEMKNSATISQDYTQGGILSDHQDAMKESNPEMKNNGMISQDYTEGRILSDHRDAMKEFNPEMKNKAEAEIRKESNSEKADKVYKILFGRKFLIILDDLWSAKVLNFVKRLFPNDNNKSRILLTTRLGDVATYADSSTPSYEMRLMDGDQSWNLLRQKVFADQDYIPWELETTGREIARSCGGLPLAMVVVAGLLSTVSKTRTSWKEIAKKVKSSLATTDGQIEKILSLSYNHLPHHLRPCFLYIGGFPEDHEIKVIDLMRLWIAEGFVKPVASKSFEESAEGYLEDLIKRNLVVVSKTKSNGKIKNCSLHDLVRELCIKLCQEDNFIVHVKGKRGRKLLQSLTDQRRISVSNSDLNSFDNIFSSRIRTILYFEDALGPFGSFQLLRVLDVLSADFESRLIPYQFFELFHLRYLAFCYRGDIPRGISNLQSLQTLIAKGSNFIDLPHEIWNMRQLRHLYIPNNFKLAHSIGATLPLETLQTLGIVRNLTCSLSLLHMIPNLKKLSLIYSWGSGDLLFHNLVHLHRLEKLKLELERRWRDSGVPSLVLPSSLKKLALIGWGRYEPYIKIVGPLPNLEVLKLRKFSFMYQEWTTSDQEFPKLKFLLIHESNLKRWKTERSHFPALEHLLIHSCLNMSEIPDDMGEITTLKLIEIKKCHKSLEDSVKLIQEEELNYGDDVFQVRCIGTYVAEVEKKLPPVVDRVAQVKKSVHSFYKVSPTSATYPRALMAKYYPRKKRGRKF